MNTKNTTCPQCGAQGTAGRFCEYCGAQIPMPVTEAKKTEDNTPFSWYNVIPHGYEIYEDGVEGDYAQSLFMVVKAAEEDTRYWAPEGVIDRHGKFIIDCNKNFIKIYIDTYDCRYSDNKYYVMKNLQTGETIYKVDKDNAEVYCVSGNENYDIGDKFILIEDKNRSILSIFDIQKRESFTIPSEIYPGNNPSIFVGVHFNEKTGLLDFFKDEEKTNGEEIRTTWLAKLCNGTIEIIEKEENKLEKTQKSVNQTTGSGCMLFLIPFIASLLYYLL